MKIIRLDNISSDKNVEYINNLINKKTCLIGLFDKNCIHCQNMKPNWELLKNNLKKKKCKSALLEIDSSGINKLTNYNLKNNINGFPSIMIYKNGNLVKEYNGNRTYEDLHSFFRPHMLALNTKTQNNKKLKKNKTKRKTKTKN